MNISLFFFLSIQLPTDSTRNDTSVHYTTLFQSMCIRRSPYQCRTAPFLRALCSHALWLCSQGYNMPISSVLCRTQEALQRERAAGASLDNVRTQAIRAATAWGREAALAERLEQNRAASRSGA